MDVRGPYDISNLGTLFGLNFDVAKKCISSNCNSLILHGATRHAHQGVFKIVDTQETLMISKIETLSVESKQAKRKRQ